MNQQIRILYVDDYPFDRELVRDALEKEHGGFELVEAASREEFEAALAQGGFDLILSDFNILGFEGLQVLEAAHAQDAALPVIIVTGTGSEEVAAEAIKRGAADYVIKTPKHIQRLPHIIHTVLEKQRLEAERQQAKIALRESEDKFKYVFDDSISGMSITLLSGEINVNRAFCEMLGYTQGELQNQRWQDITYPDDAELSQSVVDALLSGEQDSTRFSKRYIHKNGSLVWADVSTSLRRDEAGKPLYFITILNDITARRQAEEALRQSEERYRLITDHVGDIVWQLDPELRFVYLSPAVERVLGYTPEEALGVQVTHFIDEKGIAQLQEVIGSRLRRPDRLTEYRMKHKDGHWVDIEVVSSPVFDHSGQLIGFAGITRDISERKQAEQERERLTAQVHAQAQQMEQILATVPAGVLLLDAERRVVQANPVAEKYLAVLTQAKAGDSLSHLGDHPLTELLTSPPTKGLWHEVKADGRTFEIIARPVEAGPEPEHWVLVINDVTREREVQTQLQQQERLAAVGQLAAGIAHDFNNIMAVIVLYTQMVLKMPDLTSKSRERLDVISGQARRATALIQQILDFSRRAVLERRPMDLAPFLKEVVTLLERTVPESIKIELTYGTNEYTVNADPTRLQQAVMNLVINARDAMPEGGELSITLSRNIVADEARCAICGQLIEGEWMLIRVTDTGIGIAPDVLPYIFDPFFTTKEVGKGTGLGLPQVYGIVAQHEGHIQVTTQVGTGTTFTLYLPALLTQPQETSVVEAQTFVNGHGEIILVVEDDAGLREALVDSLELLDYRVLQAANGREALGILEHYIGKISLVLSDMVMPEMGGQALFHAMRQRGLTLPVVMLTGHPMENELQSLQAQDLAGWMLKPPNIEQLSHLVERALREAVT